MKDTPDEVVFAVAGSTASPAVRISLADAGLREREHLQEWVIAHPEIIGPDVMIVTFEFDHWMSSAGVQKDRLDVLGLGQDGRIVVAELKRGRAPDAVDMQALKYAAMASRFKAGLLAEYHSKFTQRLSPAHYAERLSVTEALAKLETHSDVGLLPDQLINPRVVLLAESFPPSVTATAVWLNERGVDVTLMRYQAYRTGPDHIILTVSQLYPVREVADFEIAPHTSAKSQTVTIDAPEVPWDEGDLAVLAAIANATTLAIVDLCALQPDTWIAASDVYDRAGVTVPTGTGQLGGFGLTVRSKFKRINPPYERQWSAGGANQAYYRMGSDLAKAWLAARGDAIEPDQSQNLPIPPDIVPVPGEDSLDPHT